MKRAIFLSVLTLISTNVWAESDPLADQVLPIRSQRSHEVLLRTLSDLKSVLERYQPALDSSSKIVRPVEVSGTSANPIMQVSIQKCLAFLCKTVDLDNAISVVPVKKNCDDDFLLTSDLSRSSALVRDIYEKLELQICYRSQPDGRGVLHVSASAVQASTYSQGMIQAQMLKMLQMQVAPLVKALEETLKAKENH